MSMWRPAFVVAITLGGCAATSEPPAASPRAPAISPAAPPAPAPMDFSFARGRPVAGSRLTPCGRMSLATTHTEPFGLASFHTDGSGSEATVQLGFDRPIRALDLTISAVRSDETLAEFNVGNPVRLSGSLTQTANGWVTTSRPYPADDGRGALGWIDLDTQTVTFVVRTPPKGGVVLDQVSVLCP